MSANHRTARPRKILFLLIYLALTGVFSFAYYLQYYRHLDCFNELGRCYDPDIGFVYTESGMVWGVVAAVFASLAGLSVWRLRRR
ncbi:hypothetical protein [Jannaschia sp. CCS1]|uniref:hypothetical protein n=1 Tax=Jannaschia sp. (strain CCS1) TaxID=290400 RepID=UPI000053B977|nr:hypothetical protein [Jannaschia sp. CCS1]ABD54568.1 hypothetical protein Jann_1651 [Jannaschia sp. CCS1]